MGNVQCGYAHYTRTILLDKVFGIRAPVENYRVQRKRMNKQIPDIVLCAEGVTP